LNKSVYVHFHIQKIAFILSDQPVGPSCISVKTTTQQVGHTLSLPELKTFSIQDLFYSEATPFFTSGYRTVNNFLREGNGELMLLLVETLFFCKCLGSNEKATVIYIDSYPGDHFDHISDMFENIEFRLYDVKELTKVTRNLDRVKTFKQAFKDEDAHMIAEEFSNTRDRRLLYISNLRNDEYGVHNTNPERNSDIVDEDMWNQLKWARIMKPFYALIRYRPKLETERPHESESKTNVSKYLTDPNDPISKRRLYYKYVPGYFIRPPMVKRTRKDMILMTCNDQTNGYTTTETYYHDDIISMCKNQDEHVRKVVLYTNPMNGTYSAICGLDVVKEFIREKYGPECSLDPMRFVCGTGWDHRAMFFIMSMYINMKNPDIKNKAKIADLAIGKILDVFTSMESNATK
jgi:hypothetical protein